MCLLGHWIAGRSWRQRAENVLIAVGAAGFAFAGCGGLMAILLLKGALNSTSLTGEALEQMFLPSIPYYIAVNGVLEILVIPLILYVGWRPGRRRILIVAAAALGPAAGDVRAAPASRVVAARGSRRTAKRRRRRR